MLLALQFVTFPFTVGPRLSQSCVIGYLMKLTHVCCDDSHPPLLLPPIYLLVTTPVTFLLLVVGGTDRLIREGWGKKLGRQQAYLRTLQLGKYSGGEYRDPAGLLGCGRGGLRLRAYQASLRQDGKKVMLMTTRTLSESRIFNLGLLGLFYTMRHLRTT
jgi:hypothetical protein